MPRGFTLLELIVALLVIGVLLAGVGPNVGTMYQTHHVRKLASELKGAFQQARSEAVLRNKEIYLRLHGQDRLPPWSLQLYPAPVTSSVAGTSAATVTPPAAEQSILYRQDIGLAVTSVQQIGQDYIELVFDKVNGKPAEKGSIHFHYRDQQDKTLRLEYFKMSGRISLCGVGGEHYGYPKCS